MNFDLNHEEKLELIAHLTEVFPHKSEQIFNKAGETCRSRNSNFDNQNENIKIDQILKLIFEEGYLNQELILLLKSSLHLKSIKTEMIIKNLAEEEKNIKNNPFFHKTAISKQSYDIKSELESLMEKLVKFLDKLIKTDLQIENLLRKNISFITNFSFIPKNPENFKSLNDLKLFQDKMIKVSGEITELYKNNLIRLKQVENELNKLNEINEKNQFLESFKDFSTEFNNIILEQTKIINQMQNFTLNPIENLLNFPDYINNFTNYIMSFPMINNFSAGGQQLNLDAKSIEAVIKLEADLLNNFKLFIESNRNTFDKFLPSVNPKDKKINFKNRFFDSVKNRYDADSLKIMTKLLDILY